MSTDIYLFFPSHSLRFWEIFKDIVVQINKSISMGVSLVASAAVIAALGRRVGAVNNGLARTPQMGWVRLPLPRMHSNLHELAVVSLSFWFSEYAVSCEHLKFLSRN